MEAIEIIDDDTEEFENLYYRNANRRPRAFRPTPRALAQPMRASTAFVRRSSSRPPIVNSKYGSLKWGLIADAAAKALAAVQPLPGAPTMGEDATRNLQNLADYHAALAGHAKASQQLHTLGSILKVVLP